MSKSKFTRSFSSLQDFADQFGTAYVETATPPGVAAERIHAASGGVKVRTQADIDKAVKKEVGRIMRQARGGKRRVGRAVPKSGSKRVRKIG